MFPTQFFCTLQFQSLVFRTRFVAFTIQPRLPPYQLLPTPLPVWLCITSVSWHVLFFPPEMPTPHTYPKLPALVCLMNSTHSSRPSPQIYQALSLWGLETGVFSSFHNSHYSLFLSIKPFGGREQVFLRTHKHLTILTHQWDQASILMARQSQCCTILSEIHTKWLWPICWQRRIVRVRPHSVCGLKQTKWTRYQQRSWGHAFFPIKKESRPGFQFYPKDVIWDMHKDLYTKTQTKALPSLKLFENNINIQQRI